MRIVRSLVLLLTLPLFAGERYIVEYRAGAFAPQLSEDAPRLRVRRQFTRLFRGAAIELAPGQSVDDVARLPYVAGVYRDGPVQILGFRNGGGQAILPVRPVTNANGSGIVVAVIDTGVDGAHPALAGKVIGGWDFANDDADPTDDHSHGTHVAGIIAAQSEVMTGVAPGVSILAYKALDRDGNGHQSDVIAALERTVDPNGDGDTSDRARVVNLSLGWRGHPNDPMARAAENAVAAGVVVVAAAGNASSFHSVGTPAAGPNVIAVGASTVDDDGVLTLAEFSSGGPAAQTAAIKPDVVAPGVRILSTVLDHQYELMSGTSMASPYVAGLAALLLEQHPDWTPARVKAALVATAMPLSGHEVMEQGTGYPDLARATANALVVSATQLSFGLDSVTAPSFSTTRRFTVRNEGAQQTVHAAIAGGTDAIALSVAPADFTLAAGESREVEVTLTVDHTKLAAPATRSLAFGGLLTLQSAGGTVRMPWAFVRAGRATVAYDGAPPLVAWSSDGRRYASFSPIAEHAVEALLEPATYDFFVSVVKGSSARVIVKESVVVNGDVHFSLGDADAPHALRFEAWGDGPEKSRSTFLRVLVPRGGSLLLPTYTFTELYTSAFSERVGILATQAFVDSAANVVHVAQHPPLRGLSADRTLTMPESAYAPQQVRIRFPDGVVSRNLTIMPRDWPRSPNELGFIPPTATVNPEQQQWTGTLYMTPEVHADYGGGVQFSTLTNLDEPGLPNTVTPVVRRNANGFFAARGFDLPSFPVAAAPGEAIEFGTGPTHFLARFRAGSQAIYADAELVGARGDLRRRQKINTQYRLTDTNGAELAAGTVGYGLFVPVTRGGKMKLELNVPDGGRLTAMFDSTNATAFVPSLTSLAVLDAAGRHATSLPRNGNGTLVFSAAAHHEAEYRRIAAEATKVFFRRRGTSTWVAAAPVQTGEDTALDSHGRPAAGVIYRVDLADALRLPAGEFEIAIEIRDEQGNVVTWETAAFTVTEERAPAGKRRSVR